MKILQIPNYISPHIGGIEQTARDVLNAIKGVEGAEQEVFCYNEGRATVTEEVDGVKVTRCGCFIKLFSQSFASQYKKLLKKKFAEFNPDVVIFHFPNPYAAHYLLRLLKKYPKCHLVVYYHLDITRQKFLGKFVAGQTTRLLKAASKVVATSQDYVNGSPFLAKFAQKCVVIPSCFNEERLNVDLAVLDGSAEIRKADAGKTILFAFGRHVKYKGMQYLIDAAKLLGDKYKIYIGGEGPLTEKLKRRARSCPNVEFLGKLPDDKLKAYLYACDIFCFPSITKNEAFGLSLAEAMYYGKPSVTFTVKDSGVNFVSVNGLTGIEVENRNVRKYAEAIEKLSADGSLRERYGNAARVRVCTLMTFSKFSQSIKNLLADL